MEQKIWTPARLMELRKHYGIIPDEVLADKMGLTVDIVQKKANNLGMRKKALRGPYNVKPKQEPTSQPRYKRSYMMKPAAPIVRPPAVYKNKTREQLIDELLSKI